MPGVWRARRPIRKSSQPTRANRFQRVALLGLLGGIRKTQKATTFVFLFLLETIAAVSLILFRGVIVPSYTASLWIARRVRRSLPTNTNLSTALATRRSLPLIAGIAAIILHAAYALTSREISPEHFGRSTILFNISANEFIEDYDEVAISDIPPTPSVYRDSFAGVARTVTVTEQERQPEQLSALAAGDTALLKPTIGTIVGQKTRTEITEYTVQPGDTASTIASKFGVSINTILWENNLSSRTTLRLGQKLRVLPTSGIGHTVRSGESVSRIAKLYGIENEIILRANNLSKPEDIRLGQKLIVPGGRKITPVITPKTPATSVLARFIPSAPAGAPGGRFLWPTTVRHMTQYFGWRHTGVDIGGPIGTPLFAAEEGVVITAAAAGWNGGYGKMVIIDHGDGVTTLYGHATKLLVSSGQHVNKGQTIALMGSTGRSTGSHIHFEVRVGGRRVNPLSYIR
ncbi:MAG: peptidoglycan DD-metalloendopeptidase family protein [bacterium]|nr:peptidoglycan DD-metalloendopeptidase family protein [bacterium]